MCQYCNNLDWKDTKKLKDNLHIVSRAIKETKDSSLKSHLWELSEKLINAALPMTEADEELEKAWSKETYGDDYE